MTILAALEAVKVLLPAIKTFIYADLNEANANYTDQLTAAELPVLIVMPINTVDGVGKSGLLKSTFELQAFLLDKSANITTEYSSSAIETEVIAPIRLMARRYMHLLNEHSIIDPETQGITSIKYNPVYSSMDTNLFGVNIIAQVPVVENPLACLT